MGPRVTFVGRDLNAVVRLSDAGGDVTRVSPEDLDPATLAADIVVIDLDACGPEILGPAAEAAARTNVVGFYSHVDAELGRAATEAGIRTVTRGRFWRTLPQQLGTAPDRP